MNRKDLFIKALKTMLYSWGGNDLTEELNNFNRLI